MKDAATDLKSLAIAAAVLALGWTGSNAIAPERRHGEVPGFMAVDDADTGGIAELPPLRKVAEGEYPALVGTLDPGAPAGSVTRKDGSTVYEDARPAVAMVSWLDDGRPRRDRDGEIVGVRIELPTSCIPAARRWIGHALPMKETEWRLPSGDTRYLHDVRKVRTRMCDGPGPDAAYDRRHTTAATN